VHLLHVVAGEVGHALTGRVEQGHVLVDQLDGVPVAGHHEHLVALLRAPLGEACEDVVRLVVLHRHRRDVHRLERVLQQRHLTHELGRGVPPGALVLGIVAGAEGRPGQVEGDAQVGGLLLLQEHEEHREEAVDGVRVLPAGGLEAVDGEGVERPEGQRMTVDQQEGRLIGL
jgi:hypothetical protein